MKTDDPTENIAVVLDGNGIPEKVIKGTDKGVFIFNPEDEGKDVVIEFNSE